MNKLKLEQKIINFKTFQSLLESNVLDAKETRNKLFEGTKKAGPLSRFVDIMGKSKCRKETEIATARELPEKTLAKSAQFNIYEI